MGGKGAHQIVPLGPVARRRDIHFVVKHRVGTGCQRGRHRVEFHKGLETHCQQRIINLVQMMPLIDQRSVPAAPDHCHVIMENRMEAAGAEADLAL